MSSNNLHRRTASFASRDDTHSAVLPEYSPVASVPPSYAFGSDTASVLDPGDQVEYWRNRVPSGSPVHEILSVDTSSNLDMSINGCSSPVLSRDCEFLTCARVCTHTHAPFIFQYIIVYIRRTERFSRSVMFSQMSPIWVARTLIGLHHLTQQPPSRGSCAKKNSSANA